MLNIGDTFLSNEDQLRINTQQFHEDLYMGSHVYDKKVRRVNAKGNIETIKISQLLPLPQTISETWSDLLFLEFPHLSFKEEVADDLIAKLNAKLQIDLLEAQATNSAIGMLWWVLYRIEGVLHWKFVQPQYTLWKRDKHGKLIDFKIFKDITPEKEKKTKLYKITEHSYAVNDNGDIIQLENGNKIHIVNEYKISVETSRDNELVVKTVEVVSSDKSDLPFIPVIEVNNMAIMGMDIGRSDYQGKEDLFKEIDNRYAQINYVINENADPWILMPPGVLTEKGHFNRSNGKMIEKGAGSVDNQLDIVTWDGALSSAFEAIKSMVDQLFFTCRLSPSIIGLNTERSGNGDSGRALKWRSINTLTARAKRQLYWNVAFKQFFQMASFMQKEYTVFRDKELVIQWQDGFPIDTTEVVDNVIKQVSAGLMSRETAIIELKEVDTEQAKEEIAKIDADNQTKAQTSALGLPPISL